MTPHGTLLKTWIVNQRSRFVAGKLADWKIEKLNSLDPGWNKPRANWDAMFECAKKFSKEHGKLASIPSDYTSELGIKLNSWISDQRKKIKNGKLPQERIEKLTSIGFVLDPLEEAWEQGYAHAKQFFAAYGHLDAPNTYCAEDAFNLGEWLRGQRRSNKTGKIQEDRKAKLDCIGMDWDQPYTKDVYPAVLSGKEIENNGLRAAINF